MKRTKLEEWVDEISKITNPCPLCAYIDKNGVGHSENVEVCKCCCWYYPSQFKERKKCNECIEGSDYRPFKNCDELVEFWSKNYQSVMRPANTKPFIWVRLKVDMRERLIVAFGTDFVEIGNKAKAVTLQKLFDDYEFLDGCVIGVKKE